MDMLSSDATRPHATNGARPGRANLCIERSRTVRGDRHFDGAEQRGHVGGRLAAALR
jgi:hypothetical protein